MQPTFFQEVSPIHDKQKNLYSIQIIVWTVAIIMVCFVCMVFDKKLKSLRPVNVDTFGKKQICGADT